MASIPLEVAGGECPELSNISPVSWTLISISTKTVQGAENNQRLHIDPYYKKTEKVYRKLLSRLSFVSVLYSAKFEY